MLLLLGWDGRGRTCYLLDQNQPLYQVSYIPMCYTKL